MAMRREACARGQGDRSSCHVREFAGLPDGRSRGRPRLGFEVGLPAIHDERLIELGIVFDGCLQALVTEQALDARQVVHAFLEPDPSYQVSVKMRIDLHPDMLMK